MRRCRFAMGLHTAAGPRVENPMVDYGSSSSRRSRAGLIALILIVLTLVGGATVLLLVTAT